MPLDFSIWRGSPAATTPNGLVWALGPPPIGSYGKVQATTDPAIIDTLDEHGDQTGEQQYPLHVACLQFATHSMGRKNLIHLLKHTKNPGVSVSADSTGYTSMHGAVLEKNAQLLRILYLGGVPLEDKDKGGRTPLDLARAQAESHPEGGYTAVFELLEVLSKRKGEKMYVKVRDKEAMRTVDRGYLRIVLMAAARASGRRVYHRQYVPRVPPEMWELILSMLPWIALM